MLVLVVVVVVVVLLVVVLLVVVLVIMHLERRFEGNLVGGPVSAGEKGVKPSLPPSKYQPLSTKRLEVGRATY